MPKACRLEVRPWNERRGQVQLLLRAGMSLELRPCSDVERSPALPIPATRTSLTARMPDVSLHYASDSLPGCGINFLKVHVQGFRASHCGLCILAHACIQTDCGWMHTSSAGLTALMLSMLALGDSSVAAGSSAVAVAAAVGRDPQSLRPQPRRSAEDD